MSALAPKTETSFEQAMDRLEEIVSQMEGDRMPLDEMVSSYEEGMSLLKVCRQRIDSARRRIEIITADAEGKPALTPFDPAVAVEPAEEKAKPAAPARKKKAPEPEDDNDDIRLF